MIIGIDLGTTHSEVAVVTNGIVQVLSAQGQKLLPSVVGLSEQGQLLIGEVAKNQALLYPEKTVKSIKRKMGQDVTVSLGAQGFTPQEISALILKQLKVVAEQALGQKVEQAVITVPAHFSEVARRATLEAGQIAGLEVVRMINEPTAAALAYGLDRQEAASVLVYDLGGGTFDVSVVRIEEGVTEILASDGDSHLGGDDFDEKIVQFLCDHLKQQTGFEVITDKQALARLYRAAEQAKCQLSDQPFVLIEEEYLLQHEGMPVHLSVELSRMQFEAMISPLIQATISQLQDCLRQAKIKVDNIDEIILVGGSTRIPMIRRQLFELFGQEPRSDIDPELCVAQGAAVQAAIIEGQAIETLLIDVSPHSYGCSVIGTLNGQFYPFQYVPIIPKNIPLPVSKSEAFETCYDQQEFVDIAVYQGEHPDALENIKLGEFRIEGLTPAAAGSIIIVTFSLDLNGLLTVTAREKATGLEKAITIDQALSKMAPDNIEQAQQKITALFGHLENGSRFECLSPEFPAEKVEEIVRIQPFLKQAESMLGRLSGAELNDLQALIDTIHEQIQQQDVAALDSSLQVLKDYLGGR
jgi:molecular chaperone DnaK (HSP70)